MVTVNDGESNLASNGIENPIATEPNGNSREITSSQGLAQNLDDELAEILGGQDPSPQEGVTTVQQPSSVPQAAPVESTPTPLVNKFLNSHSIALARKLGYGLLVISLVDFIFILIPPQFLNPVWEYKVIGDIIKLVPLPIFAMLLIFVGERTHRQPIEQRPLKILSWLTLGISIFFFLLLPLIVTDYVRIDRFNNSQISSEINLQKRKLNATQEQLAKMDAQQVQDLIPRRGEDGSLGNVPESPEKAKESIVNNIERAKSQADERAAIARENVTLNLVKNSVKLFLQSLLSAVLYLLLWKNTKWARVTKSKRRKRA